MAAGWPIVGRDEELALIADVLRDPGVRGVVLSGDAGVGKTRLAREAAARAGRGRRTVRWAIGTEELASIAFGALAPLLPGPDAPTDRFERLGWARRALAEQRLDLLVVDDGHLVDDLTAALAQQLVATGAPPRLLLTARDDGMPAWLADLARDDRVEHVRVDRLGEADVAALVDAVLPGSVDPATHARLWACSRGNALWLRQLISEGLESGGLRQRDGVWWWDGPDPAPGLAGMLGARLAGLPERERATLGLVAVGEPLPQRVVRALGIEPELVALDRRSLVDAPPGAGVRMAHPLLGSLLRAQLSEAESAAVHRRLIAAFGDGADTVRVARWQLEFGDGGDPELMITASRAALPVDPVLAERFAAAAVGGPDDAAARYALARALLDQARLAESEAIYAEMLAGPLPPQLWAEAMMDSAYFLFWAHGDAAGAIERLRAVEAASAPFRAHAASLRSAVALFSGATAEALAAGLPITATADDPRVLQLAAIAVVPALTLAGRVGEAIALAERTRRARGELASGAPGSAVGATYRDAQLGWEHALALRWAGRIDDAVADADEQLRRAAAEPIRHPESYGLRNAAAGDARLAAGDVRSALDALRVGAAVMREADQVGTLVSCLSDLARAEALAGDLTTARRRLAEAAERRNPAVRVFDADLGQARAVVRACGGDLGQARAEAARAAAAARECGQPAAEAASLHLIVRFGDRPEAADRRPELVTSTDAADRLSERAASTDAALVAIFAAHAHAAVPGDAAELAVVAERFGAAGARLLAANTWAEAARRHRAAGRRAAADHAAQRSRAWSARCPGAPLPTLLVEPAPLTARERDIVRLARRGLSNQQIADELGVSVRTAESHLQHAYTKLGVSSREQLPPLTDPPPRSPRSSEPPRPSRR